MSIYGQLLGFDPTPEEEAKFIEMSKAGFDARTHDEAKEMLTNLARCSVRLLIGVVRMMYNATGGRSTLGPDQIIEIADSLENEDRRAELMKGLGIKEKPDTVQ
jgi:hypothetical protein